MLLLLLTGQGVAYLYKQHTAHLLKHSIENYEVDSAFSATASTERVAVRVSGSLAANNSEALRDAALTGLGIALLPDFSAQASLQAGKLVRVLPGWSPVGSFAGQLYAIRPYAAHVPRAVTALVAYLREALAGGFGVVQPLKPPRAD